MSKKYYVGSKINDSKYEIFQSEDEPTQYTHGDKYIFAIGPFKTKRGAVFMAKYGKGNPHCQHVNDAEELAKLESEGKLNNLF